jgi:hypothetical protein
MWRDRGLQWSLAFQLFSNTDRKDNLQAGYEVVVLLRCIVDLMSSLAESTELFGPYPFATLACERRPNSRKGSTNCKESESFSFYAKDRSFKIPSSIERECTDSDRSQTVTLLKADFVATLVTIYLTNPKSQ